MHEAQTIEAKHIFIDIVEYTHDRCVEAQSDLIEILNRIVKETITELVKEEDKIIYSSTGDGMCITLVNVLNPYDIHMQIALLLLEKKAEHNQKEKRKMRTFDIRIGINENTDNLILDINGEEGVSGSGINDAARLEGLCDKSQILVGKSVHNKLEQREMYIDSFTKHKTTVKHGKPLEAYQYIDKSKSYINNETPEQLKKIEIVIEKKKIIISELQAFYMINCIKYNNFLLNKVKEIEGSYILKITCLHFSEDELTRSKENEMTANIWHKKVDVSFEEYYKDIAKSPFWVLADFASLINEKYLRNIKSYFNGDDYFFINNKGKEALINSYPDLCKKHDINI